MAISVWIQAGVGFNLTAVFAEFIGEILGGYIPYHVTWGMSTLIIIFSWVEAYLERESTRK
jgi:hypothetical protein